MKKYILCIYAWGLFTISNLGCRKFVEVPPPVTQLAGASVFATNSAAASALSGIYVTMETNSVGGGEYGISAILGLSADEFNLFPGSAAVLSQVYANAQTSNNPPSIWFDLYNLIYQANAVIVGTTNSANITPGFQKQIIGESEFIRAFCYFYLVNLYGNVPLVTTTDYKKNEILGQSPDSLVYQQIITDLKQAKGNLGTDYLNAQGTVSGERVRPNSAAASALLARVYLFTQQYNSAEQEATLVINNPAYILSQDLNSVFLTSSQEAIWQLELPPSDLTNTPDGAAFVTGLLYGQGPNNYASPYTLSDGLMSGFEPNDLRRANWTDSLNLGASTFYFPYKYKLYYTNAPPVEYPTLLRLAEQYLIRVEARAQQGDLAGAASDLNSIRIRAGLDSTKAVTQADLLKAVLQERRVELFTEYGHRWLDLKRTGNLDIVMPGVIAGKGGGPWLSTDSLYAIPLSEIQADHNLKQNPGYQ